MGNVSPSPRQLFTEAIIFWAIGLVIYVGRIVARIIANGGIKRLFVDDYVMTATFAIYTTLLVLIQISARYATNLMDPNDYDEVLADPKQVSDRIYGSKIVIGLEQCMLVSTWGVKACMLMLYWRITQNLKSNLYIKILSIYVAIGFVVIMVTYYAVYCRPFSQYWAMPVDNMQCATYQHYSITQAVFNISSDAVMFAIPIPLLIKAQLKRRRKVVLIGVMSLGLFTIIAAILNKYFNFASPLTTQYQIWYIREASTAIYVANLMCWWPLLRKIFGLKAFQYNSNRGQRAANKNKQNNSSSEDSNNSQSRPSFAFPRSWKPPCRRGIKGAWIRRHRARRSSTEAINRSDNNFVSDMHRVEAVPLDNWDKTEELELHRSTAQGPFGSHDKDPKTQALQQDMIYSEDEFDGRANHNHHIHSPC
ncbi:unnamed protein product [Penicillium salamii]|uniref:Rhodopsin domain-containing protein n=1 Tax=Penicillium salamii TaxID=1612424 RepID=A0A9W4J1W5_9EURO|nr:unnamed protein product [Penicillium salamii]CAG8110675.1 unnamed protein product [Penicillium salamii]CAG8222833.1 unnamed protein product [Penicillium salamii]CAG8321506.1 unnamed protein product [Penicillium salamii]CAG8332394.1 unnamed protein product [Penicillium salamii]